jgi:Uma2 family endonuclease
MKKPIPIEERDDITVDEMEHMSLPCRADLYDGRIVYRMATFAHGLVEANVAGLLGDYLDKRPIGVVAIGVNFRLWSDRPKESRVADVCFIANERVPKNKWRFPAMAPDLAVEIIQPDDDFTEMMEKAKAYLQQGAKIVWLILISSRKVLVCTAEGKRSVRDVLTADGVLPDFALPVHDIFEGLEN